jgi:hypothetical protein
VAGVCAAGFIVFALFVRRRRRLPPAVAAPVPVAPVAPAEPAAAPSDRLARAAAAYRHERSAAAVVAVRAILFELAGVSAGATLIDALRALGDRDAALRAALIAAEAAAFGPALDRPRHGDAMLAAIDDYAQAPGRSADAWTR